MSTAEERFSVPEQMTEAGLVFFYTSEQARNFVVEFINTAQANDFLMFASLRATLREDNGESFRKYVEENRVGIEESGITSEELEQALSDHDRAAALILRGRRDARAVFSDHGQFLLQTVFGRVYASFLIYLVDLLTHIFRA